MSSHADNKAKPSAMDEKDDNSSVDSFELISEMNSLINPSGQELQEPQEPESQSERQVTLGTFLSMNEALEKNTVETNEKTEKLNEYKNEAQEGSSVSKLSAQPQEKKSMAPSTSRPNEMDSMNQKFPVVLLTKLDEDKTSMKLNTLDKTVEATSSKQFNRSTSQSSKKATTKSEAKKSAWYDHDASLSDISVSDISLSDSEDLMRVMIPEVDLTQQAKSVRRVAKHSQTAGKKSDMRAVGNQAGSKEQGNGERNDPTSDKKNKSNTAVKKKGEYMKDNSSVETRRDYKKGGKSQKEKHQKRDSRKDTSQKDKRIESGICGESKELEKSKQKDSFSTSASTSRSQSSSMAETEQRGKKGEETQRQSTHNDTKRHRSQIPSDGDRRRSNKRQYSGDSSTSESAKIKKLKAETVENVDPIPKAQLQKMTEPEEKVPEKKHLKYEICLNPVSVSDLANASVRKFINLASDCAVYFNKKQNASEPRKGNVVLYFGDLLGVQSAMQRLSQLTELANNMWVNGSIKCYEIQPPQVNEGKDQWKKNLSAKLNFEFCVNRAEKLRQLIPLKDRKKEGTKRKSADINRIPSSMTQEMLSLLFPFSLGVKISATGRALKGPVEVEFESQDWMEAVLTCFRNFAIFTKAMPKKPFYLVIKNFSPLTENSKELPPSRNGSVASKQSKTDSDRGRQGQTGGGSSRSPGTMEERNYDARVQNRPDMNRGEQRKRPFTESYVGHRLPRSRDNSPQKRSKLNVPAHLRGPPQPLLDIDMSSRKEQLPQQPMQLNPPEQLGQLNPKKDDVRNLAISQGLDPNNQDVLKILEMTSQLETLQSLVVQQTAQANSLGITGLPSQQGISRDQPREGREAWGMKQWHDISEVMKRQEARQAMGIGFVNRSQDSSFWPKMETMPVREKEETRRRRENEQGESEIDKAESMLKGNIASRLKQLEELQMKMKSNRDAMEKREKQKKNDWSQIAVDSFSPALRTQSPRHIFDLPAESKLTDAAMVKSFQNVATPAGLASPSASFTRKEQRTLSSPYTNSFDSNKSSFMKPSPNRESEHLSHRSSSAGRNYPQRSPHSRESSLKKSRSPIRDEKSKREEKNRNTGTLLLQSQENKPEKRSSRWNTQPDEEDEFGTVDPSSNNAPLNFSKPVPSMTTEQAVRQDTARTIETNLQHSRMGRPAKRNKPLIQRDLAEKELLTLPMQFGKNVVKKTPKQIEEEERKAEEEKMAKERKREAVMKKQNLNRGIVGNVDKLLHMSGILGKEDDFHHEYKRKPWHERGSGESGELAEGEQMDGIYNIATQMSRTFPGTSFNRGANRRGQTRGAVTVNTGGSRAENFQHGAIPGHPQPYADPDETKIGLQRDSDVNWQQRGANKRGLQRGKPDLRRPRGRGKFPSRGGLPLEGRRTSEPPSEGHFDGRMVDNNHDIPIRQMNTRGGRGTGRHRHFLHGGEHKSTHGKEYPHDEEYEGEQPFERSTVRHNDRNPGFEDNLEYNHPEPSFIDAHSEQFEECPVDQDYMSVSEKEDPWDRADFAEEYGDHPHTQHGPPHMQRGLAHRPVDPKHRQGTLSLEHGVQPFSHGKGEADYQQGARQNVYQGRQGEGQYSNTSNEFDDFSAPMVPPEHQEWVEEFEEHSGYNRQVLPSREQLAEDFPTSRGAFKSRGGRPRQRRGSGSRTQEIPGRGDLQQIEQHFGETGHGNVAFQQRGENPVVRPERGRVGPWRARESSSGGPSLGNAGTGRGGPGHAGLDRPHFGLGSHSHVGPSHADPEHLSSGRGQTYPDRPSSGQAGLSSRRGGPGHGVPGHVGRGGPSHEGPGQTYPAHISSGHGAPSHRGSGHTYPDRPSFGRGGPSPGQGGLIQSGPSLGGPGRGNPSHSRVGRGRSRGRPVPLLGQGNQSTHNKGLLPTPEQSKSLESQETGHSNFSNNFNCGSNLVSKVGQPAMQPPSLLGPGAFKGRGRGAGGRGRESGRRGRESGRRGRGSRFH